jgi:hypothetical protein
MLFALHCQKVQRKSTGSFCAINVDNIDPLTSSSSQLLSKTLHNFVSEVLKCSEYETLNPPDEPADPGEGLGQLVGVVISSSGGRQVGRAEAAEEQGKEEIQNLKKNHLTKLIESFSTLNFKTV